MGQRLIPGTLGPIGIASPDVSQTMSNVNSEIGVVTACYPDDYPLVTAACASIRHFLPDVPIAVIADKDVCMEELTRVYGVTVLRTNPYLNRFAIPLSGNYYVKWVAFLDAPFRKFLYLDSDAIVWGDVLSRLQLDPHQFMTLNTSIPASAEALNHWWFDLAGLQRLDPEFDPWGKPLFCAGAFAAWTSLFDAGEIHDLLELYRRNASIFRFGDQGFFNYAVFRKQQRGEIRVSSGDIQIPVPDLSDDDFQRRFSLSHLQSGECPERAVLHFCGSKPLIQYRSPKASLFTWFRFQFFRDAGLSTRAAWHRAVGEEGRHLALRVRRKVRRWISRA